MKPGVSKKIKSDVLSIVIGNTATVQKVLLSIIPCFDSTDIKQAIIEINSTLDQIVAEANAAPATVEAAPAIAMEAAEPATVEAAPAIETEAAAPATVETAPVIATEAAAPATVEAAPVIETEAAALPIVPLNPVEQRKQLRIQQLQDEIESLQKK